MLFHSFVLFTAVFRIRIWFIWIWLKLEQDLDPDPVPIFIFTLPKFKIFFLLKLLTLLNK